MKKTISFLLLTVYLFISVPTIFAQVKERGVDAERGSGSLDLGTIEGTGQFQTGTGLEGKLASFVSTIVNVITVIAGLAFLLYFAIGGLKWITSSGEKARAEEAKTELTQAAIGLIVVAVSYFIAGIVGGVVGIDILSPGKLLGIPQQ